MVWRQRLKQVMPLRLQNTWRVQAELRRGEPELHLLPVLCHPDRTMVDIGANVGIYTHIARRYAARVLAIEPQPKLAASLRAAYRHGRVEVVACGLSDRPGMFRLYVPVVGNRRVDTRASLLPGLNTSDEEAFEVEVRTLDSFSLDDVGLIKIDVEGLELGVLRGARDTLVRCRPAVIVEAEERMQPGTVAAVAQLLESLDYAGFFIWRGTMHPFAAFAAERHQAVGAHVALNGQRTGDYVNNFVFIPNEAPDLQARARAAVAARARETVPARAA